MQDHGGQRRSEVPLKAVGLLWLELARKNSMERANTAEKELDKDNTPLTAALTIDMTSFRADGDEAGWLSRSEREGAALEPITHGYGNDEGADGWAKEELQPPSPDGSVAEDGAADLSWSGQYDANAPTVEWDTTMNAPTFRNTPIGSSGRIAGVTSVAPLEASPPLVWGSICGSVEPPLTPQSSAIVLPFDGDTAIAAPSNVALVLPSSRNLLGSVVALQGLVDTENLSSLSWDSILVDAPPPPPLSSREERPPWGSDDEGSDGGGDDTATAAAAAAASGASAAKAGRPAALEGDGDAASGRSWGELLARTPPAARSSSLGLWGEMEREQSLSRATNGAEDYAATHSPEGVAASAAAAAAWTPRAGNAMFGEGRGDEDTAAAPATAAEVEGGGRDLEREALWARLEPYLRSHALLTAWGHAPRPVPLLLPRHAGRRLTVCVDLTGTLIHCRPEPLFPHDFSTSFILGQAPLAPMLAVPPAAAFAAAGTDSSVAAAGTEASARLNRTASGSAAGHKVSIWGQWRPHLFEFLQAVSAEHELFVFTSAAPAFAEAVVNAMDPERDWVSGVLTREHCVTAVDGSRVKDLEVLGRDMAVTVIVDSAFGFHLDNVFPITRWNGSDNSKGSGAVRAGEAAAAAMAAAKKGSEKEDRELLRTLHFIQTELAAAEDVRVALKEAFKVRELVEASEDMLAAHANGAFKIRD